MIKIFKINDCDWVAAENAKDALDCLISELRLFGLIPPEETP